MMDIFEEIEHDLRQQMQVQGDNESSGDIDGLTLEQGCSYLDHDDGAVLGDEYDY